MRKIFIDLGGNDGCSVNKFRKLHDHKCQYEIYTFEPNSIFHECYLGFNNHYLIKKAAWIYDGDITFYVSNRKDSAGSSLYKEKIDPIEKISIIENNPIQIDCIDFSNWLKNNFTKDDHIILKMDIEGAEYEILNKMIIDNTTSLINKLFIEWHIDKIPSISTEKHQNIINTISKNIQISEWDALKGK